MCAEIAEGTRPPLKDVPYEIGALDRCLHYIEFLFGHPDLVSLVKRRFIDQVDLEEDAEILSRFRQYYAIKHDINYVNYTALALTNVFMAGVLRGDYEGLNDPTLHRKLEANLESVINKHKRRKPADV